MISMWGSEINSAAEAAARIGVISKLSGEEEVDEMEREKGGGVQQQKRREEYSSRSGRGKATHNSTHTQLLRYSYLEQTTRKK
jgi:hypothetical protein